MSMQAVALPLVDLLDGSAPLTVGADVLAHGATVSVLPARPPHQRSASYDLHLVPWQQHSPSVLDELLDELVHIADRRFHHLVPVGGDIAVEEVHAPVLLRPVLELERTEPGHGIVSDPRGDEDVALVLVHLRCRRTVSGYQSLEAVHRTTDEPGPVAEDRDLQPRTADHVGHGVLERPRFAVEELVLGPLVKLTHNTIFHLDEILGEKELAEHGLLEDRDEHGLGVEELKLRL